MIKARGLSKTYMGPVGAVEVLRGVDFDLARGERLAVVGASGAGKSTLLQILGALDHPSSGQVLFEGQDVFRLKGSALDDFRNQSVGFIFQFHQLLPEFSALENVMMPALIGRVDRGRAMAQATELLKEVGLSHRLGHKPGELSGGEQQRVAIARALVRSPKVLLADEPTGNLDSGTSADILALLDQMHAHRDLSMVVVTHSEALASRLDRVVQMEDGCLKEG